MKYKSLYIIFSATVCLLSVIPSYADNGKVTIVTEVNQSKKISGVVLDEFGEPIIGANVVVKGSTIGTVTDIDGKFELNVPSKGFLEVSYIGYSPKSVEIKANNSYKIILLEDTKKLEEVVVVGYGTQKKMNLTGAISTISDESISTTNTAGLATKLQGKISGLNIRQNSGEPGSYNTSINIRGFGTPLYVIDGVERSETEFQRLSPEDIESISVMKDASAAIYGLNAANGVVIVTTKGGREGKTKFNFVANLGMSQPTDMVRMANAAEYYELRNEANINIGLDPYISKEELANWKNGAAGYVSNNWADATFRKVTLSQQYSLSAEGGSKKIQYYFNVNTQKDDGLLKTRDLNYNKINFRSNITAQLTDNIKATVNVSGYTDKKESPINGIFNIWRGTVSSLPIKPVYSNNNSLYLNRVQDGQAMNPVALSDSDLTGYSNTERSGIQTNFELSYIPPFLKDLEFKGVVAYDRRFTEGKSLQKNYSLYDYDPTEDEYIATAFQSPAKIGNSFTHYTYSNIRIQANYKKTIAKDHNVAATVLFERKETLSKWNSLSKYYDFLTNDQVDYATDENATSSGNESQTRNMSYVGKVNYDYKGRYLLEFAARYDGSYRYHPNVRWGFFPVVSAGWRISEESFFKNNVDFISNFKIRGSWGRVGEDTGNAFQYISAFSTSGGGSYEFSDGKLTSGVASPALVNENMTWTTNEMKDIGFDIGVMDNKLNLTFDIFRKDVKGILAYRNVSLPNTFGATFPQENLNSTRTDGLEIAAGYQNMIGDVLFNVSANYTYGRTKNMYIEHSDYTSSWDEYRNGTAYRWNDISWGYNVIGQFKSEEEILNSPIQGGSNGNKYVKPGDFIYEDVDGNGVIDGNDMIPINYNETTPKMNYGLTLGASWKGFDLNLLFQGSAQFSVRYTHAYTTMFWQEGNIPAYFMDRWHKADPYDESSEWVSGKWPSIRLSNYVGQLYEESNAWRKSCSYIRLKNVELAYNFEQKFIKKIGLEKVRLFASAYNVFTLCDSFVKAFDPESVATYGGYSAGWIYPLMRTYTLGLNINF